MRNKTHRSLASLTHFESDGNLFKTPECLLHDDAGVPVTRVVWVRDAIHWHFKTRAALPSFPSPVHELRLYFADVRKTDTTRRQDVGNPSSVETWLNTSRSLVTRGGLNGIFIDGLQGCNPFVGKIKELNLLPPRKWRRGTRGLSRRCGR